ncbi:MAG: Mucin 2 precursor [Myxococcaceae bacterium]|nr:Mucin 2 precursor [Myxococcaceae bacterium]
MAAKKRLIKLTAAQTVQLAGIVAVIVLAVVANVLVARHFKRWDWTTGKLYTLTPATLTTLHELQEPVEVWVMLGGGDPLEQSIKQLLVSYQAETQKLDVHYIDPDRDLAALEDVRKRFKIDTGRTADGRVVTDSIMVVAKGDKHWFLAPTDMFEVAAGDEARAKPREEQAITGAIRNVLGGTRVRLCFTAGHGEPSLVDGSDDGLSVLAGLLAKDNYESVAVDTTEPNAHEPFKGCAVVIVAGARTAFTKDEEARLKTYLLSEGGSLFAALGPINAASDTGMMPAGIGEAIAPFGIALDEDLVFELDPRFVIPESRGIRFIATPKPHAVTNALVPSEEGPHDPPRVVLHFARSLSRVAPEGSTPPVDLLLSTDKSFGVSSIAGAANWTDVPEKKPSDKPGPLVLAMASERAKLSPSAPHGPRVVVVGASSVFAARNWREVGPARGAAFLVENAVSWLASKPEVLDVPTKPSVAAGIKITEDSRAEVQRYVLVFMPLATILLGLAVGLWRRSTERAPRKRGVAAAPSKKAKEKAKG